MKNQKLFTFLPTGAIPKGLSNLIYVQNGKVRYLAGKSLPSLEALKDASALFYFNPRGYRLLGEFYSLLSRDGYSFVFLSRFRIVDPLLLLSALGAKGIMMEQLPELTAVDLYSALLNDLFCSVLSIDDPNQKVTIFSVRKLIDSSEKAREFLEKLNALTLPSCGIAFAELKFGTPALIGDLKKTSVVIRQAVLVGSEKE